MTCEKACSELNSIGWTLKPEQIQNPSYDDGIMYFETVDGMAHEVDFYMGCTRTKAMNSMIWSAWKI